MATPYEIKIGNGVTRSWTVAFEFEISALHVKATVDGVPASLTFTPPATFALAEDVPTPPNGAQVRIYRETPKAPLVVFGGTGLNDSESQRIANLQVLYLLEETGDIVAAAEAARDAAQEAAGFAAAVPTSFPTIAALRLNEGPATSATIVSGETFNDGKGGHFDLEAGETEAEDDGENVIVDANGGRWFRSVHKKRSKMTADSRARITPTQVGGWFSDYDCKSAHSTLLAQDEAIGLVTYGAYRDAEFLQHLDYDTVDYEAISRRVISTGLRVLLTGAYDPGAGMYAQQYKDLHGIDVTTIGRVNWDERGIASLIAKSINYGDGIVDHEFCVTNPPEGDHSKSMAAVQAIVEPWKAASDSTHVARIFFGQNNMGYAITSGIDLGSIPHVTDTDRDGSMNVGLNMIGAKINIAAIRMLGSGNGATIVEYASNDYTHYDRTNDWLRTVIGGNVVGAWTAQGLSIGPSTTYPTWLFISPSTTAKSHLRLYPGATPTSPGDGDLWFDGTNVKIRVAGVVKTFTLT